MTGPRRRKTKTGSNQLAMRTPRDFESCAERLKSLADPDRLQIVASLLHGSANVTQLALALDMSVVKVSHHLGVLRYARIVLARRQGKFVIYSLHPEIAADGEKLQEMKTLDLGFCRLDLVRLNGRH